jgi:hypothetical protein
MVPGVATVVEMVPVLATVVEIVPALVVDMVPAKAVAVIAKVKTAAKKMDLKFFMFSPGE